MVTCAACGQPFEAKRSTAKYCGATCRQRARRMPDAAKEAAPQSSLADVTERELTNANRLDTVPGQQAMALARRLANPAGETGSAVAALSRELSRLLASMQTGKESVDEVEEARRKRDEKRARATTG